MTEKPLTQSASRGPIRVSPNGRYFVDREGQPFFWLGDTAWLITQKARREEIELYLQTRADQGFTVIQAAAVMGEERVGGVTVPNAYGHTAFIDNDPARPNLSPATLSPDGATSDYWSLVDTLIQEAERRGLIVGLLPLFVGWNGDGYRYLRTENAEVYGTFLGQRYRTASNVVWILGGDNTPDTDEKKAVWNAVARGIAGAVSGSEEHGAPLMTYHINGGRSSSYWFHTAPWLDFNMVQTWDRFDHITPMLTADSHLSPTKPTGLGEGAYEDGPQYPTGPINAWVIRKQAYWSYFAGGYHTYGNTNTWNFSSYEPEATLEWKAALYSAGAGHLTVLARIFRSLAWWQLQPDAAVLAEGGGAGDTRNVAMRDNAGECILVYLSSPSTVSVHLDRISGARTARATWLDLQTGARTEIADFPTRGSETFSTPDGYQDALLLLQARENGE